MVFPWAGGMLYRALHGAGQRQPRTQSQGAQWNLHSVSTVLGDLAQLQAKEGKNK